MRGTKGQFPTTNTAILEKDQELKNNAYVRFIEKQLEESVSENKRYHAKYVDMREFAYTSVENLMRQLNSRKKNAIQNSNLNVYKQLFEKERKQWLDEREKSDQKVIEMQTICYKQQNELRDNLDQVNKLNEELVERNQCEAKV